MDRHIGGGGGGGGLKAGRQVTTKDAAIANEYFEHFLNATSLKNILGYYRSICEHLSLRPNFIPQFYPKLRGCLASWRAKALWKKFDARASHKCYGKGKACAGARVLVIGCGPCGLRTAIEAQLLGAKVVVIEKRDRLSRNNVLHLWPFVIEDLRGLGAKKFFGKFCAGAIDHISIRQLQCILLKVALLLGVEVHTEVSFERLIEPDGKTGWRGEFDPPSHPVSQFEFDVLIGADGKRNTVQGFNRKEFRGKLAIAITANFINKRTEAEARVEEISGVAFIFNQKFFKELYEATGIDLENIVYYKDDTHYFVMTAKKASLIEKGVIQQDLADTGQLLAPPNVHRPALLDYAQEAANFSTNYQMPDLEFAVNHYGQPDVALFDFTSMYAAENASKVLERHGSRLLMMLVGDSLLEPFWPTGSGCARGFLSSMDAAWAIRGWCSGNMNPLDVIAERESIYRLLAQTTPDNLNKDWKAYTLDPATRYPNLNRNVVVSAQVTSLFHSDDPSSVDRMKRSTALEAIVIPPNKKRRRGNVDSDVLLTWVREQVRGYEDVEVTNIASVFRTGKVLCAILSHYRPDLLDYGCLVRDKPDADPAKLNQVVMDLLEKEIGITPLMTGEEITVTEDYLTMAAYLTQVYDSFRCEIPHIKHPKLLNPPPDLPSHVPPIALEALRPFPAKDFSANQKIRSLASFIKDNLPEIREYPPELRVEDDDTKGYQFNACVGKRVTFSTYSEVFFAFSSGDDRSSRKSSVSSLFSVASSKSTVVVETMPRDANNNNSNNKERGENIGEQLLKSPDNLLTVRQCSKCVKGGRTLKSDSTVNIQLLENDRVLSRIKFTPSSGLLEIHDKLEGGDGTSHPPVATTVKKPDTVPSKNNVIAKKTASRHQNYYSNNQTKRRGKISRKMSDSVVMEENLCEDVHYRIHEWISKHDFREAAADDDARNALNDLTVDGMTDVTSVTRCVAPKLKDTEGMIKVEERTDEVRCGEIVSSSVDLREMENRRAVVKKAKEVLKQKIDDRIENDRNAMNEADRGDDYDQDNGGGGDDESENSVLRALSNYSNCVPFDRNKRRPRTASPSHFSVIMEGEEIELPDSKTNDTPPLKSLRQQQPSRVSLHLHHQSSRPSSRHKRHAPSESIAANQKVLLSSSAHGGGAVGAPGNDGDKKPRKRKTLERFATMEDRHKILEEIAANRQDRQNKRRYQRKLQTEQFLKSMQMLQANAKTEGQPFEDYSLFVYRQTAPNFGDRVKDLEKKFTYVPDHDNKLPQLQQSRTGQADEDLAARIKNLEDKWKDPQPVEKKPKDLLRAIGKIETSDWNIKEIEKKIRENKHGKPAGKDKEKVPKWSKEQFMARQTKMEKQHLDRQDSAEAKYADIDKNIKHLEMKLKEGTSRDLGKNKVASVMEKLSTRAPASEEPPKIQKSSSRPAVVLPPPNPSEFCHFCSKRVYLMERLSAEGRFFHHGCFKCQYCHTQLRLGSYAFDRDGLYDHKFFCLHHYGMQGEVKLPRSPLLATRKSPDKRRPQQHQGIAGVDLLDRVRTPERVSMGNGSDNEDTLSQMDEDEWTDRNFGPSANELDASSDDDDEDSSSSSYSDSDDEDAFEEALEEPVTKEGTLKWAERFNKRYSRKKNNNDSDSYSSSDHSSYYENSSDDEDSDTATEGEDEIRARELRKQEVRVEPPVIQTDTGTDTEIVTDDDTSSSESVRNSATEISTDSEFAHDDPTPTREVPPMAFDDRHVTKTRGRGGGGAAPRKIQVTAAYLPAKSKNQPKTVVAPLVKATPIAVATQHKPLATPTLMGYALNRTQSTGGIAAKVSLELKKKYLLGESTPIQKSGSASTLDSKLKSFTSNIGECQKLLKNVIVEKTVKEVVNPEERLIEAANRGKVVNEPEGRPRSPVHETSIVVPTIDWSTNKNKTTESDLDMSTDSVGDGDDDVNDNNKKLPVPTLIIDQINDEPPKWDLPKFDIIPSKVIDDEEIPPDSLCDIPQQSRSITKTLNQPKFLPSPPPPTVLSPENNDDNDNALTETELSDWARDGDTFSNDDRDFEASDKKINHVCGRGDADKVVTMEAINSVLTNIEFMDTETSDSSSDNKIVDGTPSPSNNGYVLFKDDDGDDFLDSLNPCVNNKNIVEAKNELMPANRGYCVLVEDNNKSSEKNEDDSLLCVDTTTEECSDSTVKNLIDNNRQELPGNDQTSDNNNRQRLEDKLAQIKAESEFDCQRLQSRMIDFGNVKDSIDVRKSRRRNSPPDLIQEKTTPLATATTTKRPDVLSRKEFIEMERDVNQKLVQEMVMNKMRAENKSLERKKRPSRLLELSKSSTVACVFTSPPPDVLLSTIYNNNINNNNNNNNNEETPVAPPRQKSAAAEKMRSEARLRAQLLSNEDLGLSPEDKLVKLREKFRKNNLGDGGDVTTPSRTKSMSFDVVIGGDVEDTGSRLLRDEQRLDKKVRSDPNLLDIDDNVKVNKKSKDRERRKSIAKILTGFFTKGSPKGFLAKISPGGGKCHNNNISKPDTVIEEKLTPRRRSLVELTSTSCRLLGGNNSPVPPPVPPLPTNYRGTEYDSCCSDNDHLDQSTASSCLATSNKRSSRSGPRRSSRQAQLKRHRMAQEIQRKLEEAEVKTRELESRGVEVEKALRGEEVTSSEGGVAGGLGLGEKLRASTRLSKRVSKDESELLHEWFDLMRDRTELRRYERELMVRARELELEDRHARLQHDLRERLENDVRKTPKDVEIEGSIIKEMMDIVAKRDDLIALLEEDRLRYSSEDRDFEEQMLAKGLRLTPIRSEEKK